ncbi:hypothetical protein GQ43DRAFT_212944 [Delitschia confertaspora ATCC 74209]|uniref:Uncharacterized protein n=1 Tax=Delitschia confertaspora ATCC 74209 TaxID=1513339 RepID=A0A9P4JDW5_9PLEO|nr:hypothetical protein GQ43DRAFT_212944 [Delitschia confertaspora ATCC 74209]
MVVDFKRWGREVVKRTPGPCIHTRNRTLVYSLLRLLSSCLSFFLSSFLPPYLCNRISQSVYLRLTRDEISALVHILESQVLLQAC